MELEIKEDVRRFGHPVPVGRHRSVSQRVGRKKKTKISKRDDGRYVVLCLCLCLSSFSSPLMSI